MAVEAAGRVDTGAAARTVSAPRVETAKVETETPGVQTNTDDGVSIGTADPVDDTGASDEQLSGLADTFGEDKAETEQKDPFGEGVEVKEFEVQKWSKDNTANSTVDGILASQTGLDPNSEEGMKMKAAIKELNGLDDKFTLQPGQQLKIPDMGEPEGAAETKPPREMSAEEIGALSPEERNEMATAALDSSNQAWNMANEGFGALPEDQKIAAGEYIGAQMKEMMGSEEFAANMAQLQEANGFNDDEMANWRTEFAEMAKLDAMAQWANEQNVAASGEGPHADAYSAMAEGGMGYLEGRSDFLSLAPNLAGYGF